LKRLWVIIFNLILLSLPGALVWAGEGLDVPQELGKRVNLANLSGLNYFFAHWYNDNIWLYALIVTVLMGVIGMLIALVTDIILKMIGMEIHKIEHHE
jgi:ABC-type phosphate/phosphonate transport system permease subunit